MTPSFCQRCAARLVRARIHDRTRRRCPRCGFVWYDNPVPAVIAVLARRGRVLMVRRASPPYAGTWDLPGGFMEAGELPEQTLRRELREELGLAIRPVAFLGFATDRYGPAGFRVLTLVYAVRPPGGRLRPADDVSEARWFAFDEVPWRDIAFPAMRRLLRKWISKRRAPRGGPGALRRRRSDKRRSTGRSRRRLADSSRP